MKNLNIKNDLIIKMRKTFFLLSLSTVFTISSQCQISVGTLPSNGDVIVGDIGASTASHELNVLGRIFVTHNFRMADSRWHSGMSGSLFDIYTPTGSTGYNDQVGSADPKNPIFRPQWGSHFYLGSGAIDAFKELHINDGFLYNGSGPLITSDKRQKENISTLSSSLSKILRLEGFTYDMIFTPNPNLSERENTENASRKKNKVGFMAQDIKEDFPNLVRYNESNDVYAVDYTGFIPYIVKGMQEQQEMIESLKSELTKMKGANTLKENSVGDFGTSLFGTEKQGVSLAKHAPVSAKQEISINYNLPEGAEQVMLIVYDLTGKQLFKIENVKSSNKTVSLPKSKLSAGQYLYTLIANGEEVATHKLIILD